MHAAPEALEAELQYRFRNAELLRRALTHKSYAHEKPLAEIGDDNEQLEFLGDSILGFAVSEWLVANFPDAPEGRLSKMKAYLVSASHLHHIAQTLQLGDYLIIGRGEELSGGRKKKALLADALEALIAAIYLDGGIQPARNMVIERILSGFDPAKSDGNGRDYKGELGELARALNLPMPRYEVIQERGPEHAKTFLMEVRIGQTWVGTGEGPSKKDAGQKAAETALEQMRQAQL